MLYASELENNTIAVKSAKTVKSVKVVSFNAQCYNSGFFLQSILSRQKAYFKFNE